MAAWHGANASELERLSRILAAKTLMRRSEREQLADEELRLRVERLRRELETSPETAELRGRAGSSELDPERKHHGNEKPFVGSTIESAVRLRAHGMGRNALMDETGLTKYVVDFLLPLVDSGHVLPGDREGRLKVAGIVSATPSLLYLSDLKPRS